MSSNDKIIEFPKIDDIVYKTILEDIDIEKCKNKFNGKSVHLSGKTIKHTYFKYPINDEESCMITIYETGVILLRDFKNTNDINHVWPDIKDQLQDCTS
jgi:hypothetical protein